MNIEKIKDESTNKIIYLRKKLFSIIGGTVVFAMILSAIYSGYILKIESRQEKERYGQTLQVYIQMMEESMDSMESLLIDQCLDTSNIQRITKPGNGLERSLTLVEKKKEFDNEIKKYKLLNGLFLYDESDETFIGAKGKNVKESDHTAVKNRIKEIVQDFGKKSNDDYWFSKKIDGAYYLLRIVQVKNIYYCAWMKADYAIADLAETEGQENIIALGDKNGNILSCTQKISENVSGKQRIKIGKKMYSMITVGSEKRNISLTIFQKDRTILNLFRTIIMPIIFICIIGIMVYYLIITYTKEVFLNPLDQIFIKKEREKNKAELQFLQLQTNPHFLNNCLSLIRNLVFLDRKEEAQEVVIALGKYTRTSLNSHTETTVAEELNHIDTYYHLIKLRFHDKIELTVQADPKTNLIKIPTMIIQTFVENSIKHQMSSENILEVSVQITLENDEYLIIQIEDNGDGFDEQIRPQLKDGIPIEDEEGVLHIGVSNVVHRLKLLYDNRASIHFENKHPKGASVTIFIPLKKRETIKKGE